MKYNDIQIEHWSYIENLEALLKENGIEFSKDYLEYDL